MIISVICIIRLLRQVNIIPLYTWKVCGKRQQRNFLIVLQENRTMRLTNSVHQACDLIPGRLS